MEIPPRIPRLSCASSPTDAFFCNNAPVHTHFNSIVFTLKVVCWMNSAQKLFDLFEVATSAQKPRNERVKSIKTIQIKVHPKGVLMMIVSNTEYTRLQNKQSCIGLSFTEFTALFQSIVTKYIYTCHKNEKCIKILILDYNSIT